MSRWPLRQREDQLYREAKDIPTWVLADKSRRFLLDTCRQLWELTPTPTVDTYEELSPVQVRRLTVLHLGQLIVRATGAQMMLIATGYEREAFGQVRITTEAHLRTRQVVDDKSGESARSIMAGRTSNIKRLAHRYGQKHDIELLDHFAHADVLSLRPLGPPPTEGRREAIVEMQPTRGLARPAQQLLEATDKCVGQTAAMVEVFELGVLVPPSIGDKLRWYRDNPLPTPL
jgi:hypothetical protein